MEDKEYLDKFEDVVYKAIRSHLLFKDEIDDIDPDAPDIEGKWEGIAQSYLADGVREFNGYPTVSLGWMMFVGMALAKFWDEDWEKYSQVENLYLLLRNARGYDYMDEHICEDVLLLDKYQAEQTSELVREIATIAHHILLHEGIEPGTAMAFYAYVRTIHQMYKFGAAVELKRLGYHMTKL